MKRLPSLLSLILSEFLYGRMSPIFLSLSEETGQRLITLMTSQQAQAEVHPQGKARHGLYYQKVMIGFLANNPPLTP